MGRTVTVELIAKAQGLVAGMATGKKAVQDFSGELVTLGKTHKDQFNQLALSAGGLGLSLVGVFGSVVKSAADFDKEMSAVQSVANTSVKGLGDLRAAALQAGKDTAYSATEAAQAEEELAKAGVSTSDILGGALAGSLSLAAAGQMDLADAATISAQAMNVWQLQGSAVGHIADVLAASANKSAADMSGLGDSIKQGGLVAAQTGLSLEDTVGTLSAFADRALVGSDAGTSLKTMLQALANPSQKSAAEMKQLGINAYDAQGKFVGIANLAGILQDKLGGLTDAQRGQALAQIFGSDAMRAASILYQQGASGIQDYIDAVNDSGAASETARAKMNNLSGDIEQLKGSVETLAIQSGGGGSSGLRLLAQGANAAVTEFMGLPPIISETGVVLSGVGGAGILAAVGLAKARQSGQEITKILADMGPVGAKAATALSGIGKIGGALGIAGVAGFAAVEGVKALVDLWSKSMQPVRRDVDQLTDSLAQFSEEGRVTGELAKVIGTNFEAWGKHVADVETQEFWAQIGRNAGKLQDLDKSFQQVTDDTKAMDTSLAKLVTNGQTSQAKAAFDEISRALTDAGYRTDQINQLFPQYTTAANQAAAANKPLAQGFGDVSANASLMTEGLQDAIDHGLTLKDVFEQLDGAAEDSKRGEIDFKQSIADLTDSFKQNGKSLDDNTQKGRDNLGAVLDTIDAAQKAAEAKYNETGSVQSASDVYNAYIAQLRATLKQAHLTDDQINALIGTYGAIPPAISTSISAPGVDSVTSKVLSLKAKYDALNGRVVTTTIIQDTVTGQTSKHVSSRGMNRWGGIYQHAADGALRDASVYSSVMPGRYMIAEQGTGGEAFVPRFGDYRRSTGILDQASQWYGGRFTPGGWSSPKAATPAVTVSPEFHVVLSARPGAEQALLSMVDARVEQANQSTARAVSGGVRV